MTRFALGFAALALLLATDYSPVRAIGKKDDPKDYRVLGADKKRIAIVNSKGEIEWEVPNPEARESHDIQMLPNGGVLFQTSYTTVVEVNKDKQVVWKYEAKPKDGVRLAPGVTVEQIQKLFDAERTRVNRPGITDLQRLAVDPSLIGPDGRANPALLTWNTTPGEFGQVIFIRDKNTFQWDMSMTKEFRITEKVSFELFGSLINVLNHPRWGFRDINNTSLLDTNVFSTTFDIQSAPTNVGNGNRSINLRATLSF